MSIHLLKTALLTIFFAACTHAASPQIKTTDKQIIYHQAVEASKKQDYTTAFKLLLPLAKQGDAIAQNNIAVLYHDGLGVKQNDNEALKWYRKAAEQGIAEAQFDTGLMYARGQGTEQNYTEAAKWYEKAAKQGHSEAQNNLAVRYATGTGVKRNLFQAKYWFGQAAIHGHATAAASLRELNQMEKEGNIKKSQQSSPIAK